MLTSSKLSDMKSHIIHGEPSQKQKDFRMLGPHDGQSDRMSDKSDMRFSTETGDRSRQHPHVMDRKVSSLQWAMEICNCNCV